MLCTESESNGNAVQNVHEVAIRALLMIKNDGQNYFYTLSFSAVAASCMEASNPPSYKAGYGQACSQGGFEGVRRNPPCSLAKLIFNETAAVQGTIIQPCSGIVTDGIQAIMQLLQGTYMSSVEAFATGIKNFDR